MVGLVFALLLARADLQSACTYPDALQLAFLSRSHDGSLLVCGCGGRMGQDRYAGAYHTGVDWGVEMIIYNGVTRSSRAQKLERG